MMPMPYSFLTLNAYYGKKNLIQRKQKVSVPACHWTPF